MTAAGETALQSHMGTIGRIGAARPLGAFIRAPEYGRLWGAYPLRERDMDRRRFWPALVSAMVITTSLPAGAQTTHDYWIAGYSMNGPRLAALAVVDAQSIAPTHDRMKQASVWLFVSPLEQNQMAGWALETTYEYDCDQRSRRFLGGRSYNQAGEQIRSEGESQNWRVVGADSIAGGAFDFVCSTTRPADAISLGDVSPQQVAQQMFAQPSFDPTNPMATSRSQ